MPRASSVAAFNQSVGSSVAAATKGVRRQDGPSGRFYDIDGESFPSVTHILGCIGKPALIQWAAKEERTLVLQTAADLYSEIARLPEPLPRTMYLSAMDVRLGKSRAHQRALAKAGEIGTQVHALIEYELRQRLGQLPGPAPAVVDDARWAFMAWEDWATSVQLEPIWIEQMVYSRTHRYAGTLDLFAKVQGVPTVIDFKTGKAIYAEAHLQNVAYQHAWAEMGQTPAEAGLIVRLPKVQTDPAFEVAAVPPVAELLPTFLAVQQVWRWWFAQEEAYRAKRQEAKG